MARHLFTGWLALWLLGCQEEAVELDTEGIEEAIDAVDGAQVNQAPEIKLSQEVVTPDNGDASSPPKGYVQMTPEARSVLEKASPETRRGFRDYLQAWKECQAARANR